MKKLKIKLGDEGGNTIIEATFIVTITLFMLVFLLLYGIVKYQFATMQSVANEAATGLARTYSYTQYSSGLDISSGAVGKDPVTGFILPTRLTDQGLISSTYWLGSFSSSSAEMKKNGKLPTNFFNTKNTMKNREGLAEIEKLISRRSFMVAQDYKYDIEIKHSELAWFQNEIIVTIEESYNIPLAKVLGAPNGILKRTVVGKAICTDYLGAYSYYNTLNKAVGAASDNPIAKTLKNCVSALTNCTGGIKAVFDIIFKDPES